MIVMMIIIDYYGVADNAVEVQHVKTFCLLNLIRGEILNQDPRAPEDFIPLG